MYREQNYENPLRLNFLYLNISNIVICGFGRNSATHMRTFRTYDVKRFETQKRDDKTPPDRVSLKWIL